MAGFASSNLAVLHHALEAYNDARQYAQETLTLLGSRQSTELRAHALHVLGFASWKCGDQPTAGSALQESLALLEERGDVAQIAVFLINCAPVVVSLGHGRRAGQVLGSAEAILRGADGIASPSIQSIRTEAYTAVVEALGRDGYEEAIQQGSTLPLDAAVALVRETLRSIEPSMAS